MEEKVSSAKNLLSCSSAVSKVVSEMRGTHIPRAVRVIFLQEGVSKMESRIQR